MQKVSWTDKITQTNEEFYERAKANKRNLKDKSNRTYIKISNYFENDNKRHSGRKNCKGRERLQ